jgi:hypothetical protein
VHLITVVPPVKGDPPFPVREFACAPLPYMLVQGVRHMPALRLHDLPYVDAGRPDGQHQLDRRLAAWRHRPLQPAEPSRSASSP